MDHSTGLTDIGGPQTGGALSRVGRVDGADLIRYSSRLGVWGVVGGLVPVAAVALGMAIPAWMAFPMMGAGFIAGGVGISLASGLSLGALRGRKGLLRIAALAGIPLGGAVTLFGAASSIRWSPLVDSLGVVVPTGLVLAGLVLALLVVDFLVTWMGDEGEATEDPQN